MIGRRGFITGLVSLVVAPAIVRAGSLMPVKVVDCTLSKEEIIQRAIALMGHNFPDEFKMRMDGLIAWRTSWNEHMIEVKALCSEEIFR